MNKFKKVMLGALSVLTLGLFVATGAKVVADGTHPGTYFWKNTETMKLVSTDSENTHKINLTGASKSSTTKWSGTYDSIISGQPAVTNVDTSIKLSNGGTISLELDCKFDISIVFFPMNSANWSLTFTAEGYSNTYNLVKADQYQRKVYSLENLNSGTYTLTAVGKECHIYEILVVQKSAGTIDTLVANASTCIENIGTVTYDNASFVKLVAARNAINDVNTVAADENYYSTNYSEKYATYTAAWTAYNSARSDAMTAFTSAVEAIGTVTLQSEALITSAEEAYAVLFGDALADADVVDAKSTLDAAKNAYFEVIYSSLPNKFSTKDIAAGTYTGNTSTKFELVGNWDADTVNHTILGTTYAGRLKSGGETNFSKSKYIKFKTTGHAILRIIAISGTSEDSNRVVHLYNSTATSTSIGSFTSPTTSGTAKSYYLDVPTAGTYYIGTSKSINFYELEIIETEVSTATLEQQENSTGSAIRYIATVKTPDTSLIKSWNVKFTLEGKNSAFVTESYTVVYTAVAGNNGKSSAENTYYLVATLNNIPASFNGRKLTAMVTVTLEDDTKIESNILTHTVAVTE